MFHPLLLSKFKCFKVGVMNIIFPFFQLCLNLLDTVVCYSYLPSDSLYQFVITMCNIVNIEKFCQTSWLVSNNLLNNYV